MKLLVSHIPNTEPGGQCWPTSGVSGAQLGQPQSQHCTPQGQVESASVLALDLKAKLSQPQLKLPGEIGPASVLALDLEDKGRPVSAGEVDASTKRLGDSAPHRLRQFPAVG